MPSGINATQPTAWPLSYGDQDLAAGIDVRRDRIVELAAVLRLDREVSRDPFLVERAERGRVGIVLQGSDRELHVA